MFLRLDVDAVAMDVPQRGQMMTDLDEKHYDYHKKEQLTSEGPIIILDQW